MYTIKNELTAALAEIENAGLTKRERLLTTPQGSHVTTTTGEALNFCANNYLGLADHPAVVAAAKDALDELGFGMASVRFICGSGAAHAARARAVGVPRDGGHDSLQQLLRRERRRIRGALRRG